MGDYEKCKKCGTDLVLNGEIRSKLCIDCSGRKWLVVIVVLSTIMIAFGITYFLSWGYPINRDVWDVLDRAQITAESEDMFNLVDKAIVELEVRKGLFSGKPQTEGHCAWIFKKPSNSLDAQYLALKNIRTRLKRTNTFSKSSVEYQSAIDDIRGTIRELPYLDCWIWHFK